MFSVSGGVGEAWPAEVQYQRILGTHPVFYILMVAVCLQYFIHQKEYILLHVNAFHGLKASPQKKKDTFYHHHKLKRSIVGYESKISLNKTNY